MSSQVNSVSFLVYTLLCVKSCSTDSWVWCQNWRVLGDIRGCKSITVCNPNANLPEAAKFQNSIFRRDGIWRNAVPAQCRSGRMPPSRRHWSGDFRLSEYHERLRILNENLNSTNVRNANEFKHRLALPIS